MGWSKFNLSIMTTIRNPKNRNDRHCKVVTIENHEIGMIGSMKFTT